MFKKITQKLAHPAIIKYCALLAMILTVPSLFVGWQFDDHFHRVVLLELPEAELKPMEMFTIFTGNRETNYQHMDIGLIPWWTSPDYRLSFLRYLSILDMWLDYRLWPEIPPLMHLHSILWYGAIILAAGYLFKNIMPVSWLPGLAILIYALDDAHALPVGWLANRNALLASFFGILSILFYDRWRRIGVGKYGIMSPIFLVLGLASGEMALGAFAYLISYALFLDQSNSRTRFCALIPHTIIMLGYFLIYRIGNFGAHGSEYYQDPFDKPVNFIKTFLIRGPVLLFGQLGPVQSDIANFLSPEYQPVLLVLSFLFVAVVACFLVPLIKTDRTAQFWFLGMLFSLVPITAVATSNRLLLFVGLGGTGLISQFVFGYTEKSSWIPDSGFWKRAAKVFVILILMVHIVLSPLSKLFNSYSMKIFGEPMIKAIQSIPSDDTIADQNLVIINTPNYLFYVSFIPPLKILHGHLLPERLRVLSSGPSPIEIRRINDYSVRVTIHDGLFTGAFGKLFVSSDTTPKMGEQFKLTGMTATVLSVTDKNTPREILYTFSVPLEDQSLRWLAWKENRFVSVDPPPRGSSMTFPAPRSPFDILRK